MVLAPFSFCYLLLRKTLLLLAFTGEVSAIDDEYRYASAANPKIVLTTSHDPSAKLKVFSKVNIFFFSYFEPNVSQFLGFDFLH